MKKKKEVLSSGVKTRISGRIMKRRKFSFPILHVHNKYSKVKIMTKSYKIQNIIIYLAPKLTDSKI
jgi:hypothetical protein